MSRRSRGRPGTVGARASAVALGCVGGGLILGVVAAFAAGASPSFTPRVSYRSGVSPSSVAIGDLDGDGRPELVTADYGEPSRISAFRNRGGGSFEARRDYETGGQPISVALGDLNGDGTLDLATANNRGLSMSVLLNRGDGSFEPKRDYRAGVRPRSIAIGDLTGDGKPDAVTANTYLADPNNRNPGTVSVFVNKGDGSFEPKVDYRTGKFPLSVAIRDLNDDGKPDLVTANLDDNTASVLLNHGDGTFEPKRDYRTADGPRSVAVGDLNGDSKPDIVTVGFPNVSVFANRGDGSFRRRDYRARTGGQVAIGDLNGDKAPDLAMGGSSSSAVAVLPNRGDGSFAQKVEYRAGGFPSVAIGDLNSDGRPDLASANFIEDTVAVLINRPGLCTVQLVVGMKLATAKRATVRANCRVGTIRRAYSQFGVRGSVVAQRPKFGAVRAGGARVNLVVSRGRKH